MSTSWSGTRTAFPAKTRARILKRQPTCVECNQRPSTIADHEPNYATLVRMGVTDPHDEQYGQGLCAICHDAKTRREQHEGRERLSTKRPLRRHPSD